MGGGGEGKETTMRGRGPHVSYQTSQEAESDDVELRDHLSGSHFSNSKEKRFLDYQIL